MVKMNISVKDTGIGIKEEDLQKLFDDFVRIEESRNKNIEGSGLGMSIAVQLLELMNSKLKVSSVYGSGSEFSFDIEQKIISLVAVGNISYENENKASDYEYEVLYKAPEAKLLLVDDNAVNRMVFVNLLKETDIQITEADSGEKALELVMEEKYDIIFLDHMMPDMDGIEVMHRIKSNSGHPNTSTPVLALTANAISGVKEMYLKEGFNDYISKPIIPDKLEKILFSYLPEEKLVKYRAGSEDGHKLSDSNAVSKESMDYDLSQLPVIEGVDWNYAMLHFKNVEQLLYSLKNYVESMESEADNLEELYKLLLANNDFEQYRIKVHALKSSSTLLGITPLAGVALLLEQAAREELIELIKDVTPYFINNLREYRNKLSFVINSNNEKKDIDDYSLIADYLNQLKDAVSVFDVHGADSVIDKLKDYNYSLDNQVIMDELKVAVNNLDVDAVINLCDKVLDNIANN